MEKTLPQIQDPLPIAIGQQRLLPVSLARNTGVLFDNMMTVENHISECCRKSYFLLRSIDLIKKRVTKDSLKTVIRALVTSRLDNKALYRGLPFYLLEKLKRVQNFSSTIGVWLSPKKPHHPSPRITALVTYLTTYCIQALSTCIH